MEKGLLEATIYCYERFFCKKIKKRYDNRRTFQDRIVIMAIDKIVRQDINW